MPMFTHGVSGCTAGKYFFHFDFAEKYPEFVAWCGETSTTCNPCLPKIDIIPSRTRQINRSKNQFDILYANFLLMVSEDMKILIEEFEPKTHLFFKIDLYNKSNEKFQKNYYWMKITECIDATIREKSSLHMEPSVRPGVDRIMFDSIGDDYRCLRKEDICNHHIWIDKMFITYGHVYFSDELYCEYIKRNLSGVPKFYKAYAE